jgi:hypothetical protein
MGERPSQRIELWKIRSHDYRLTIWPPEVWRGLPPGERPRTAFRFGNLGWVDVRPVGAAPPLGPGRLGELGQPSRAGNG